jgi:Glycosyltransferase family 87
LKSWPKLRSALLVALALFPAIGQCALVAKTDFLVDFSAFYCAGRAAAHRESSYAIEPLARCEQSTTPGLRHGKNPKLVVPAPLPGYDVFVFVPLSRVPFPIAAAIWLVALLLACVVCVFAIARVAGAPWGVVAAALSLSLAALSIPLGQIVPLVMAAIALCAYYAWQGRWHAAAAAAVVSMAEPHLGIGVCAAFAIWSRPARPVLIAGFAALILLSSLAIGPAENVRYFSQVLPAHALSEAPYNGQYSVTAILTSLGVADREAVHFGSIWYLVMVIAGVLVGGALFRKRHNGAWLAWAPPACAVFGGVYVHLTQIAVAVGTALLLLRYETSARRIAGVAALVLLALPWHMTASPMVWLAPVFPMGYLVWFYSKKNLKAAMIAGALAAFSMLAIDSALISDVGAKHHAYAGTAIERDLPEAPWSEYLRSTKMPTAASWFIRIPTWTGLLLLLWLLSSDALRGNQLSRRAEESSPTRAQAS